MDLQCIACHTEYPVLNTFGRMFKLTGYTLGTGQSDYPPLAVMLQPSFTRTALGQPGGAASGFGDNNNWALAQASFFYAGRLFGPFAEQVFGKDGAVVANKFGIFLQATYDGVGKAWSWDNTEVRYADTGTLGGQSTIYGFYLNNNPTLQDPWNSTPAWGFPFVADDWAPTPTAAPIIASLGQDVAGFGGYMMWNNHLYADATLYRSGHVGNPQPNDGTAFGYNIRGLAPYWRVAWQQLTGKTQYEVGTYGMHMRSSPGAITGPEDDYTDYAVDAQIDRTVVRTDVLSWRATYIRENSNLLASTALGAASPGNHHLNTFLTNAEYHFGNKYSGSFGWFDTSGTIDPLLFTQSAVGGSANGDPRGAGYIANFSVWPWQNLQLSAQYTGYTKFNGGSNNYDGAGRNAGGNNTVYLVARFIF